MDGHAKQTLDIALKDLRSAAIDQSMPKNKMQELLFQHEQSRSMVRKYRAAKDEWLQNSAPWLQEKSESPIFNEPKISKYLPTEFANYFQGCIAYYQGRYDLARQAWTDVLNLPPIERRYRSTWAAFMLGKLDIDSHPENAAKHFRSVRTMTDEGYVDSLGLAASSLGWEAQILYVKKDYHGAIEKYLEQMATGSNPSAYTSLTWVIRDAFQDTPEKLRNIAQSAKVRRVVSAYLASRDMTGWYFEDEEQKGETRRIRAWVEAIEEIGVKEESLFEVLALAAYQRGLYDLSQRLLGRAPKDGVLTSWLQSKLLFREGRIEEAADMLSLVVRQFPVEVADESQQNNPASTLNDSMEQEWLRNRTALYPGIQRIQGEHGIMQLHRGDFIEATDALLRSGYWMDAAYVAERVLTLKELKDYIDSNWPDKDLGELKEQDAQLRLHSWNGDTSQDRIRYSIRYLLARRLARMDRSQEASNYFPSIWQEKHDQLQRNLERGRDVSLPPKIRAQALWAAAKTTRYDGLELIGTELAPDWAIHDGNFERGVTIEQRQSKGGNKVLMPTNEETRRATQTRLHPFERFHYRYLAADIAWEALELMPENNLETARVYCEAGAWIKSLDPQAANLFYKALVKRCSNTPIGQAADRLRWFPNLDQNGALVNSSSNLPNPK
ncbi:MAG: hypothetical protein HOH33_08515 [Verrucomicrobia bacterium]|nr:hypothetical protein [Verrucomicrobiota bacterium]